MPIRDLALPTSMPEFDKARVLATYDRIRKVVTPESMQQMELTLTKSQLEEIEKLVKLFSSPDKLPTVDELVALKSEFADAILRELAKTSSENLDSGLRKIKETMPKQVLDEIKLRRTGVPGW